MNAVSYLLEHPFPLHTLEEQVEIKRLGRPMPRMEIVKLQNFASRCRKFSDNVYLKNSWLCGCGEKNVFYCFPCVLFGGSETWSKNGTDDLVHIANKIAKHEKTKAHMNNALRLSLVDEVNIQTRFDSAYRAKPAKRKAEVEKNRHVLNLLINCMRFCDTPELAARRSDDQGGLAELFNFGMALDKDLKEHLCNSPIFKDNTRIIQNELLDCMLEVYHQEITVEINSADFVALIADETTDISCEYQLAVTLRYIVDGRPVERFWKFVNPEYSTPGCTRNCLLQEIEPLIGANPHKLISQSYDGTTVMSGGLDGVQKLIKQKYTYANYIHCYVHDANAVLSKAASIHPQAKNFFAHLSGLCSFFSNSPKRMEILERVVQERRPPSMSYTWSFQWQGAQTVYQYRTALIAAMEILENELELETVTQAGGYLLRLQDEDFIFWLTFFHKIVPHVDAVFSQVQRPTLLVREMNKLEDTIKTTARGIDEIIKEAGKNDLSSEQKWPMTSTEAKDACFEKIKPDEVGEIKTEIDIKEEVLSYAIATVGKSDDNFEISATKVLDDACMKSIDPGNNDEPPLKIPRTVMVQKNMQEGESNYPEINVNIQGQKEQGVRHSLKEKIRKHGALFVCNAILRQMNARFKHTGHLVAENIFQVGRLDQPSKLLVKVIKAFPFLEKAELINELEVIYGRPGPIIVSGVLPFLSLMLEEKLEATFPETLKLLKALVTLPMPTIEAERCISALEDLKTFLRHSPKDEKLSALGMLMVEKNFLNNIDNFNKKVIDMFASKDERKVDFSYLV